LSTSNDSSNDGNNSNGGANSLLHVIIIANLLDGASDLSFGSVGLCFKAAGSLKLSIGSLCLSSIRGGLDGVSDSGSRRVS